MQPDQSEVKILLSGPFAASTVKWELAATDCYIFMYAYIIDDSTLLEWTAYELWILKAEIHDVRYISLHIYTFIPKTFSKLNLGLNH